MDSHDSGILSQQEIDALIASLTDAMHSTISQQEWYSKEERYNYVSRAKFCLNISESDRISIKLINNIMDLIFDAGLNVSDFKNLLGYMEEVFNSNAFMVQIEQVKP